MEITENSLQKWRMENACLIVGARYCRSYECNSFLACWVSVVESIAYNISWAAWNDIVKYSIVQSFIIAKSIIMYFFNYY